MTDRSPADAIEETEPEHGIQTGRVWSASVLEPGAVEGAVLGPSLSSRQRFWKRFKRQKPAMVALVFLIIITLVSIFAPVLAPKDPNAQTLTDILVEPNGEYLLGTDELGRDVLSRLIYAGRLSLMAAAQAVGVGVALGVIPGLMAGYLGKWFDLIIMRVADAIMSFPALILAIAIVGVLGPNLRNAMVAVGVIFAPRFVRLIRGTVLAVREETFIEASRSIGTPTSTILRRHILPNVLSPLIIQISLAAGFSMLAEASLSFLGLGAQPPDASWGSMLQQGVRYISRGPWLIFAPGTIIALTVLSFNLLGDGIRDSIGREVRRAE